MSAVPAAAHQIPQGLAVVTLLAIEIADETARAELVAAAQQVTFMVGRREYDQKWFDFSLKEMPPSLERAVRYLQLRRHLVQHLHYPKCYRLVDPESLVTAR